MTLLATGAPLKDVLHTLVTGIETDRPGVLGSILLLDETGRLRLIAAPSLPGAYNLAIDGVEAGPAVGACGTAAFTGQRVVTEDIRTDPRWLAFRETAEQAGLRACWSEPIRGDAGRILGAFALYQRAPSRPNAEEVQAITAAARLAGIAIERRQAEEALSAREALAQRALKEQTRLSEIAGLGSWTYDPAARTVEWSPAWRAAMDRAGVDTIHDQAELRKLCHPDDISSAMQAMSEVIDRAPSAEFSSRLRSRQGRWIFVRSHVYADRSADGSPLVLGISQNITELVEARDTALRSQRRSARASREAEAQAQRLRVALSAAHAVVVEVDYENGRVWTSPQFAEVIGDPMSYRQARRASWPFVIEGDWPIMQAAVKDWLAGKPPEPIDVRIRKPDGTERWVRICTEIQRARSGRWTRTISLILDIDTSKRQQLALIEAEEAAQIATEAKSQFLANMSHEIRTPLNGILGMVQAMSAETLPDAQKTRLRVIRESGDMLLTILNDILDFSKVEAGCLELEDAEFDLEELVRSTHASFAAAAEEKRIDLHLDVAPEAGVYAGDPTRVRQVLSNLISNAIKFTDRGDVTITADRLPRGFRLSVRDTGPGIPAEAVDQIFSRFIQADTTITRKHGGTGLGLSICRNLVEMMGGDIAVDSEMGRGSEFRATFPMDRVEGAAPRVPDGVEVDFRADELRILAAEDNSINQLVLRTLLQQVGVEPTVVANGQQAVEAWRTGAWSVILMDVQMPVMDGVSATRAIRELEKARGLPRTPIVGLTANAMPHQTAEYMVAGMDACVAKPFDIGALFEALDRVTREKGAGCDGAAPRARGG